MDVMSGLEPHFCCRIDFSQVLFGRGAGPVPRFVFISLIAMQVYSDKGDVSFSGALLWCFGSPWSRIASDMPEYVAILNYKCRPCAMKMIYGRCGLSDLADVMPCPGEDYNGRIPKIQRVAQVSRSKNGVLCRLGRLYCRLMVS